MTIPNHPPLTDSKYEESIDQWLCSQCFKTVSSSRPPVFNPENCSCVEVGGGGGIPSPSSGQEVEQPLYGYDHTTTPNPLYHNNDVQSYPSSTLSFRGPEGPERENVDMHLSNNYLPLAPDTGLNEAQHRRSTSFESEMSYQMRRFLVEDGYHRTHLSSSSGGNEDVIEDKFLQQDVKIGYGSARMGSSRKVNKGSKFSWGSGDSIIRPGSEELGSVSVRGEAMRDVGAWMDDFAYGGVEMQRDVGYGYPMVMSGFTECGFEGT